MMTCETLWMDALLATVRCSVDDLAPFRARMVRAFNAGESVTIAAMELKVRLNGKRIADAADAEESGMRARLAGVVRS